MASPGMLDAALSGRKTGYFANSGMINLNLVLVLSLISSYATGYDGSMMNGLQSLDTWTAYFNNPGASSLALLNAIQNVGQLVALPFCAIACDKFGRRSTLVFGAVVMLVGTILQGAARNTGMFIAARGTIGFGLAFNITAAPLLILELAFPTQRAPLVSVYNSLWSLGAIAAAWVTYGTFRLKNDWGWRIPSFLQALSSIVQIGFCYFIEESPRWLVDNNREDKAKDLITKYHTNGDPNDYMVSIELEEIREALRLEKEALETTSYLSFFKTKGNRHRFFIILAVGFFSQWSGNGLISYYLTLILDSIGYKDQETQTLVNGLLAIWGLITTFFFSLLVNRFGRRTMFLTSTVGMLITYIIWTALMSSYEQSADPKSVKAKGLAKGVLAMIFLYNTAFSIGWGPLQVTYVVEILPYHLRARGLVLYNLFVAMALIFNQYANPIGVTNIKWKYYIVYDVWLFVELLVVYFLFVETSGSSLEETAAILDGTEIQERFLEGVARATERDGKSQVVTEVRSAEADEKTGRINMQ
ncbi:related to hexose transporter protein [Rhynchosporium secalis]|uniref:Related to hexose transporter protein n=1 Tax=Rhynchosporium secalis TaxID=38038 RepID=A0A1E1ML92_RHYSE|nr:related to hexose transporter protein [Rhynchosporium secalis]